MRYNGVYVAARSSQAISATDVLVELQVPAETQIEILRIWVGPAEGADPVVEIQEIDIYGNDAAGTSGAALTEQVIRGSVDAASGVTALGGPTIGATPTVLIPDGFDLRNGFLYLPIPDERIRVVGGSSIDNLGFRFPTAPDASITISYGIIWGEIG